jgi:hypothetical protein
VAVRVYVLVAEGDTNCVPDAGTTPIPWSIETEVAPSTFHDNVDDPPAKIFLGLAEKLGLIIVTEAITEPEPLVAVSVYIAAAGDTNCVPDAATTPIP